MSKEDRDKLLIYLTEQINSNVTECRVRAAKENGKIEGMQMVAAQIANYVRGLEESEVQDADDADTETWNGYHGQITAPKGTFKRIYADADGGDAE